MAHGSSLIVDPESQLPLLALIVKSGNVAKLPQYAGALAARHEYLVQMQTAPGLAKEVTRKLAAEELMLRQVLEWVKTQGER